MEVREEKKKDKRSKTRRRTDRKPEVHGCKREMKGGGGEEARRGGRAVRVRSTLLGIRGGKRTKKRGTTRRSTRRTKGEKAENRSCPS